jgi:hypothetical protein
MSLTGRSPDAPGLAISAAGRPCFFCGAALADPAVYWMGMPGSLFLHAACCLDLFVRLMRDVHEVRNPEYYARRARGTGLTR